MRCRVEITNSAPREEYSRPVDYHNYTEPGDSRPITPVKVTAIQAQRKVWMGGEVPVYVTVVNYVNHEKLVEVILQDYTNNTFIGKSEVVIPPQSSKTITFQWKTRGFSLGEHVLHAEAVTDPEPYYEYDRMSTERMEQSNRINTEGNYVRRRRDNELQEIVAEAEEILRRVEQEWEDASLARDRAAAEAEHIIAEADEQAIEQSRHVEGKAGSIIDDAYQQADDIVQEAEMVRKQAEEYRQRIEMEAEMKAAELEDQFLAKAEGEALEIKEQAVRYAEELLAEVQKQLEAARTLRELAKDLATIAGFDTEEVKDDIDNDNDNDDHGIHLSYTEKPVYDYRESSKEEPDCSIEESVATEPEFDISDEEIVIDTPADETEPDSIHGQAHTDETPETEDKPGTPRRPFFRWQNVIMVLSVVTAAVLLSFGLISL